jgi:hypothetical protein
MGHKLAYTLLIFIVVVVVVMVMMMMIIIIILNLFSPISYHVAVCW